MRSLAKSLVAVTLSLLLPAAALATGFLKMSPVKGESTKAKPDDPKTVKGKDTRKKARSKSDTKSKSKGKVEYQWKVEEGRK